MQGIANFLEWLSAVVKASLVELELNDAIDPEEVDMLKIDTDGRDEETRRLHLPGYVRVTTHARLTETFDQTHELLLGDYGKCRLQVWYREVK